MTRELIAVGDSGVAAAVRSALDGSGPAMFAGASDDLPATVPRRVALVVQSSGSTGTRKRVALSTDALLASAAASASALDGAGQWLLALPTSYIAGINVLVRSFAADTEPVVMAPEHFDAERFVDASAALAADQRWFTSLVPAQLIRLLESDEAIAALRLFDRVLVGGQSTPAAIVARCADLGVRITRTYGSSETSGGCVYDGVPFATVHAREHEGELQLAGPVLAEGYLGEPALTDAAFIVDEGMRWYRTNDAGTVVDGRVTVSGRLDDVIISGGLKVSLGAIEELVRMELADAVVIAADDERWGQVPVVVSTREVDLDALRARVVAALGRAASPREIVRLDAIPLLASGKPDRLRMRRELAG